MPHSSRMTVPLLLFWVVNGEPLLSAFIIGVDSTALVGQLKDTIKIKRILEFNDIAAEYAHPLACLDSVQ